MKGVKQGVLSDEAICRIIESALPDELPRGGITATMDLRDLGVDSLGLMSIVFLLEEHTGVDTFGYVQEFIEAERVSDIINIMRQG